MLWCIAAAVLGERSHAEDAVQEAALTALNKLDSFEPGTNFSAWMGQIVRFVALNHRRKLVRRTRAEDADADPETAPGQGAPEQARFDARTRAALDSLTEVARMCLLLKAVMELEYREIGEVLEIPEGTAMSHVHRARVKMQKLLGTTDEGLREAGQR